MQEFTANLYSREKFLEAAVYNMKGGYYDISLGQCI